MTKAKTLILAIVFGVLLLAGTITPIVMVLMPKSSGFKIGTNDTDTVTVPELIDSNGNVNGNYWRTLLQYLSGATDVASVPTSKTATDIRGFTYNSKTNAQSLLVTLGGIKWIAVYLSTNTSGDKILTLWQADATEAAEWNAYKADSTYGGYRSNLYGTSKIRSVTLGNGGPYYKYNYNLYTASLIQNENKTGTYAQFTNGIYTKYLEVPQNISWQVSGTSAITTAGMTSNYNNDNLSNDALYFGSNYNSLDYYDAWGSDYVWLPSMAETGHSGNTTNGGLWKVNNNERSTSTTYGSYYWLRSACDNSTSTAYALSASGYNYAQSGVSNSYAVRPALHLNLNSVAKTITAEVADECASWGSANLSGTGYLLPGTVLYLNPSDKTIRTDNASGTILINYSLISNTSNNIYFFNKWTYTKYGEAETDFTSGSVTIDKDTIFTLYINRVTFYAYTGGTVTAGGTNAVRTLTATPNSGYQFVEWLKDGTTFTGNTANPLPVTETAIYTAVFSKSSVEITNSLAVLIECANETNLACVGTVATNDYTNLDANNMEVHIVATPSKGYRFVGWKIDGELSTKYTDSATDILISDVPNGVIVAYFEKITNT